MRTLYHVPVIHSPEEFAALKGLVLIQHTKKYGSDNVRAFLQAIEDFWQEVLRRLEKHNFFQAETARTLHVFLDSMSADTTEVMSRRVHDFAAQDIPMYMVVKRILDCGACLHGTEDMYLLLKEAAYWQQYAATGWSPNAEEQAALLRARDAYIAKRIDANLPEEGIGILFLGRFHDIRGALESQHICCNVVDL